MIIISIATTRLSLTFVC